MSLYQVFDKKSTFNFHDIQSATDKGSHFEFRIRET